jgi:hypothetical protein
MKKMSIMISKMKNHPSELILKATLYGIITASYKIKKSPVISQLDLKFESGSIG